MTQWTKRTPGAGEMDAINSLKTRLTNNATTAREVSTALGDHVGALPTIWPGDGGTAWGGMVNAFIPGLGTLADSSDAVAAAITAYTTTVDDIKADEDDLYKKIEDMIGDAKSDGVTCTYEKSSIDGKASCKVDQPMPSMISDDPQGTALPPVDDPAAKKKQKLADAYENDIDELLKKFDDLATRRTAADNTCKATTDGQIPASWPATRAALADIGITNPMDMTDQKIADKFAEYIDKIAERGAPLTSEELTTINNLFNTYKNNPAVMDDVFTKLGGEDTVALIDALNNTIADPNRNTSEVPTQTLLDTAIAIRDGLAVGCAGWPEDKAAEFAQGMLNDLARFGASAFLFNGPPYLSGPIASAAADIIDKYERENDPHPSTTQDFELTRLQDQYYGDPNATHHPGFDLPGRIFETLGQYPQRAYAFLADPENGATRVDYWYRQRDWSVNDGFEGPTALWNGAEKIPSGPTDSTSYDASTWNNVAAITSAVMDALGKNEHFSVDTISDSGAANLAAAIAIFLPYLTEETLRGGKPAGTKVPAVWPSDLLDASGQTRGSPGIMPDKLAELLGIAGAHPGGAVRLRAAQEAYTAVLMEIAENSTIPGVAAKALESLSALDGFIAGAVAGTKIDSAECADAAAEEDMAAFLTLLASIPIPGLGALVGGVPGFIADGVQIFTIGQFEAAAGNAALGDGQAAEEYENYGADKAQADMAFREKLMSYALSLLDRNESIPPYSDDKNSDWEKLWVCINAELNANGLNNLDNDMSQWYSRHTDATEKTDGDEKK